LNWLLKLILRLFGQHLKFKAIYEVKRKGLAVYLRTVQGTRHVLLLVLVGVLVLQLMMLSAVGALVTGFLLLDYDYEAKMRILFFVFCGMFAVPSVIFMIVFSERMWFKASGAEKMMEDLRKSA
jgi:hypothetical protein